MGSGTHSVRDPVVVGQRASNLGHCYFGFRSGPSLDAVTGPSLDDAQY